MGDGPLLVYGPWSHAYDFGPGHPLTPRRFGPGIDLLAALGARPGLAPEPATHEELLAVHSGDYLAAVRRFSADPWAPSEAGIGPGDNPPFLGMHDAAATVAGGSLRAVEAILRGDVEHALHPGGGLHHAMPDRASGFCIYNDPALAIARARAADRRVLYIDLDVHHGDGVQAMHAADPGVLTVSLHESGMYLFPGTGYATELGDGAAAGTVVNVPLEPLTGEAAWLASVESLVPLLAAGFGPDLVVSQHGADSHVWDPLAHLRVTTTAMDAAARLVDRVAHRWGTGAWLATGGGGYDVYRVVPRAWALTWLAGAHREAPARLPKAWRDRWADEAARHGQTPLPSRFTDEPNAGEPMDGAQAAAEARSRETAALVRSIVVPRLLREAADRGWWSPLDGSAASAGDRRGWRSDLRPEHTPAIVDRLDAAVLERLVLAPRVIPPLDPAAGRAIVLRALRDVSPAAVTVAVDGERIVGLVLSSRSLTAPARRDLLALGVAPAARDAGLGRRLLEAHLRTLEREQGEETVEALVTVGERDPMAPADAAERRRIAERLLGSAGFSVMDAPGAVGRTDPWAIRGVRRVPRQDR